MIRTEKWDRKYLELAKHVSGWSKDPSAKVGAVLVNYSQRREFIGYNGFPEGVEDLPERYDDRDTKLKLVVHAEVNALFKAGALARGGVLYVYPSFAIPPICNECAKVAILSGIKEVVGYIPNTSEERIKRWAESIAIAEKMLKEAGVSWRTYSDN